MCEYGRGKSHAALMEGAAELVLMGLWTGAFWEPTSARAGNVALVMCVEPQQN